ncbi:MAG: Flp family type IVb pilin [Chloroflexota bacterium]|nr:Flp family type IVb pilin [Chloroflexota bacterium]
MLKEMILKLALFAQAARARFEQEEGQGLVEYALIIALVSAALVLALGALSTSIDGIFGYITGLLDGAATTAP